MKPSSSGPALTTASLRVLRGLPGSQPGRADQIADQLAAAIERGLLRPGQRLPSEATLASQLDVATLTLREALATLRDRGLITTRRGRTGGSFVASRPSEAAAMDRLAGMSILRMRELMDLRRAILGRTAALAASRFSEPDLVSLHRRLDRLAEAGSSAARYRADGELHVELATAAQSARLGQEDGRLRAELGDVWWTLADPSQQEAAIASRRALVEAVAERDSPRAQGLAEELVAAEAEIALTRRIELYASEDAEPWTRLAHDLSSVFDALRVLAEEYLASYLAHPEGYDLSDISALGPRIVETLESFSDLAVGAGVVPAPHVLGDAPYWLEWWWREPSGAASPLRVNLDPDEPDFFDYPHNEWFAAPVSRRAPHIAGPYVDYVCTNEYTFTLSIPVFHRERVLGVVAMDILCDRIERRVMPTLCSRRTPAVLVNPDGRVIAATTPHVAPGVPFPDTSLGNGADLAELHEVTRWSLLPLE